MGIGYFFCALRAQQSQEKRVITFGMHHVIYYKAAKQNDQIFCCCKKIPLSTLAKNS